MGGNPVNLTDPNGLFALPLAIPIGQAIVDAVTVALGGAMLADSLSSDDGLQEAIERGANHQEYKNYCDNNTPPPGMDKCEEMLWHINRLEACISLREAFDRKWGTDHGPQIDQKLAELEKWKRRYDNAWDCQIKRCLK